MSTPVTRRTKTAIPAKQSSRVYSAEQLARAMIQSELTPAPSVTSEQTETPEEKKKHALAFNINDTHYQIATTAIKQAATLIQPAIKSTGPDFVMRTLRLYLEFKEAPDTAAEEATEEATEVEESAEDEEEEDDDMPQPVTPGTPTTRTQVDSVRQKLQSLSSSSPIKPKAAAPGTPKSAKRKAATVIPTSSSKKNKTN